MIELALIISLSSREICVVEEAKWVVECFDVAVGKPSTATPLGDFKLTSIVERPQFIDQNNQNLGYGILGDVAVTTDRLTSDGRTFGLHGTNRPELVGGEVSAGCIRMTNTDITILNNKYLDYISGGVVVK